MPFFFVRNSAIWMSEFTTSGSLVSKTTYMAKLKTKGERV